MKKYPLGQGKVVIGVETENGYPLISFRKAKQTREVGSDITGKDCNPVEVKISCLTVAGIEVLERAVELAKKYLFDMNTVDEKLFDRYLAIHLGHEVSEPSEAADEIIDFIKKYLDR